MASHSKAGMRRFPLIPPPHRPKSSSLLPLSRSISFLCSSVPPSLLRSPQNPPQILAPRGRSRSQAQPGSSQNKAAERLPSFPGNVEQGWEAAGISRSRFSSWVIPRRRQHGVELCPCSRTPQKRTDKIRDGLGWRDEGRTSPTAGFGSFPIPPGRFPRGAHRGWHQPQNRSQG